MLYVLLSISSAWAEPVKEKWLSACHVYDTNSAWYDRLIEARERVGKAGLQWEDATCTVIVPEYLADKVQWCDVDHANRRSKDYGIGEAVTPEVCRVAGQIEALWGVAYSIKAAADRAEHAAQEAEDASRQAWIVADGARGSAAIASDSARDAQTSAQYANQNAGEAALLAQGARLDAQAALVAVQQAKEAAQASQRNAREAAEQAAQARINGPYHYLSSGLGFLAQRELVVVIGENGVLASDYDESQVEHRLQLRTGFSGALGFGWDSGFSWPQARIGTHLQGFVFGTSAERILESQYERVLAPGIAGFATLYAGRMFHPWEARVGIAIGTSMLAQRPVTTPWVTDAYSALHVSVLRRLDLNDDRGYLGLGPNLTIGLDEFATRLGDVEQSFGGPFAFVSLTLLAGGGPARDTSEVSREE